MNIMSTENKARQFADDFLNDLKTGKFNEKVHKESFQDFSEGLAELHRDRFCTYLKSCGCFLMNRRLDAMEEVYHG